MRVRCALRITSPARPSCHPVPALAPAPTGYVNRRPAAGRETCACRGRGAPEGCRRTSAFAEGTGRAGRAGASALWRLGEKGTRGGFLSGPVGDACERGSGRDCLSSPRKRRTRGNSQPIGPRFRGGDRWKAGAGPGPNHEGAVRRPDQVPGTSIMSSCPGFWPCSNQVCKSTTCHPPRNLRLPRPRSAGRLSRARPPCRRSRAGAWGWSRCAMAAGRRRDRGGFLNGTRASLAAFAESCP